jgi:uncharacterized protein YjbI with pentapeptide repeats
MKFDIRNRFTGAVQFTAEIDCADDAPTSIKIGLAVKWALENGANLDGASLVGANLVSANLDGASLAGASLVGANLDGASLVGANLVGANLDGAKIKRLAGRATRSDGYEFFGWLLDDDRRLIRAGCQTMTLDDYRARAAGYGDTVKTAETVRILDYLDACFKAVEVAS